MSITMKKVGGVPHHDLMIADADDILIVVPEEGFKDTADASRLTVAALREYTVKLGRKCGPFLWCNDGSFQSPCARNWKRCHTAHRNANTNVSIRKY
jgi:hypothetical protein